MRKNIISDFLKKHRSLDSEKRVEFTFHILEKIWDVLEDIEDMEESEKLRRFNNFDPSELVELFELVYKRTGKTLKIKIYEKDN